MGASARQGSTCRSCGADPGGAAAPNEGRRGGGRYRRTAAAAAGISKSRRPHSNTSPPRSGYPLARCAPTGSYPAARGVGLMLPT